MGPFFSYSLCSSILLFFSVIFVLKFSLSPFLRKYSVYMHICYKHSTHLFTIRSATRMLEKNKNVQVDAWKCVWGAEECSVPLFSRCFRPSVVLFSFCDFGTTSLLLSPFFAQVQFMYICYKFPPVLFPHGDAQEK